MSCQYSHFIKEKAYQLGFEYVGFSKAEELTEAGKNLEKWLSKNLHGQMGYMANHFEKRIDPRKLVDGAKSVVTLMYNHYTDQTQTDAEAPKLSKYAYGKDYHYIIKYKLKEILKLFQAKFGEVSGRCFVDSAPVMEREWAKKSGVGWVGKNTLLINKNSGSFYFLAELILDVELEYDGPIKDYCGRCTRCIDACPTEAIAEDGYWLDASKCISYLTIELKDAIPSEFEGKMDNWMFGCDICQDVCPWNRFAKKHNEPDFEPHPDLLDLTKSDWEELTEDVFRDVFRKSAVKRTKYSGLQRNIDFLKSE